MAPFRGEPRIHEAGVLAPPKMEPVTLSVLVADDNLLIRAGLSSLVDAQDGLRSVGACGDYDALLAAVEDANPDVVITDVRMPPTSSDEGIRAACELRKT